MDLFVDEFDGDKLVWYEQLATGGFGSPNLIATGLDGAIFMSVGDIDQDGLVDVATSAWYGDVIAVYRNVNGGQSWQGKTLSSTASGASALSLTDFDLDGDLDLAVAIELDNKLAVYPNVGGGTFGGEIVIHNAVSGAHALSVADFDADGLPDIVLGCWGSDDLSTFRNLGGLQFAPQVVFDGFSDGINCLKTADLDSDGDIDVLAVPRLSGELSWYPNDGQGSMGAKRVIGNYSSPYWGAAADIDEDNDVDVFVAVNNSNELAWHENLGGGVFGPKKSLNLTAFAARYVSLADMDADGDIDILGTSTIDNSVSIYPNILPLKHPLLSSITGLHSLDSGSVTLTGDNLLETTVTIDGQPATITAGSETQLTLSLTPDEPGGLRDIVLMNPFGTEEIPGALARYPVLDGPATVPLGQAVDLLLDNGDTGGFVLAVSGALFATPAPFTDFGWYWGLELNGVWIVGSGLFVPGSTSRVVTIPGVVDPGLLGVPFYFQAWTSQATLGYAGFTGVTTVAAE
jgi:hypothetical protein